MSEPKSNDTNEVGTTGHEWDGIQEWDNPLPRWWLYIFYACVVFAIGYWIAMPAWPTLNGYTKGILHKSDRAQVVADLADLHKIRGVEGQMLRNASLEQIEADPKLQAYALAVGQSVFGDNCATCHGTGGAGGKGYPNLRDDVWLWGGTLQDIQHTLQVGVRSENPKTRSSIMPSFGKDQILPAAQIDDLTEYVVALSGRKADAAAVQRAAPLYQANCIACHGATGVGDQAQGAPNLTDKEWLYGSAREDIRGQIWKGGGGVMPTWEARLDPETIKALAVYVHANAVGK